MLAFAPSVSAQTQADQHIGALLGAEDYFALVRALDTTPRDSLSPMLRDLANALVCHYFNRNDDAVRLLRRLIEKRQGELGRSNAENLAQLIPLNLARQGRYADAQFYAEDFARQVRQNGGTEGVARSMEGLAKYYKVLADVGDICKPLHDKDDHTVSFFIDSHMHGLGKGGFLTVNGQINSEPTLVVFDTGAGMNVISSADADRMHLVRLDYRIGLSGMGRQTGQLAIADTLRIGRGMMWRNVPFVVVDIATGNAQADNMIARGMAPVIGTPVMSQMGEMTFDFDKKTITVPAKPSAQADDYPNMMRTNAENLNVLAAGSDGQNMIMHFDTGNYHTSMNAPWFAAHREEVEQQGIADSLRLAGVGGVVMQHAYKLPHLGITVGGKTAVMDSVTVATGQDLHTGKTVAAAARSMANCDGELGLDYLRKFRRAVVNLRTMTLRLEDWK